MRKISRLLSLSLLQLGFLTSLIRADLQTSAQQTAPPQIPKGGGWVATDSSLLLCDRDGALLDEIGLGVFRKPLGHGLIEKETLLGGVSQTGRFAWHWRKKETIRPGRMDLVLSSTSTLAYRGSDGQTLWNSNSADAPAGMAPLSQSADGENVLLVERTASGWSVSFLSFIGNRITEIENAQRLERASITPNGKYGLVLWGPMDQPLIYTFLDLQSRARKDMPASNFIVGAAKIKDDGSVQSSTTTIYRFP